MVLPSWLLVYTIVIVSAVCREGKGVGTHACALSIKLRTRQVMRGCKICTSQRIIVDLHSVAVVKTANRLHLVAIPLH